MSTNLKSVWFHVAASLADCVFIGLNVSASRRRDALSVFTSVNVSTAFISCSHFMFLCLFVALLWSALHYFKDKKDVVFLYSNN